MDVTNILKACGPNPSGTGTELLWAFKKDFTTIEKPTPFATATTPDQVVTIDGDHLFASGKGFVKLQITDATGQLTSTAVGEKDGKSFEHMITGFHPNNSPANLGMLSLMAFCDLIFLVPEETAAGTIYRQVGSEQHPASCEEDNYDSAVVGGRRGTTYSAKAVGLSTHAPFYSGVVTMQP
jgi:hypothetical protein